MTVDVADRGRTTIADRVVSKIAARAAAEVERTGGASRRLLGITIGRPPETAPPRVTVHLDGEVALVHVAMSVAWPAPVRQVAQQVRDQVAAQVQQQTGLTVAEVDVSVTALVGAGGEHEGRVV
ncbi:MAG TPA: Asp23/Gls24 family envelope stress response protein [Natronosporangium sp.]|jgi:uncharacterized alkaline shock family protein YloU|nr:Asp23/Gls24 family envelope stress response protein [Natronosporangium sp.]